MSLSDRAHFRRGHDAEVTAGRSVDGILPFRVEVAEATLPADVKRYFCLKFIGIRSGAVTEAVHVADGRDSGALAIRAGQIRCRLWLGEQIWRDAVHHVYL